MPLKWNAAECLLLSGIQNREGRGDLDFVEADQTDLDFLFAVRNERICVQYSKRGVLTRDEVKEDYFGNARKRVFIAVHDGHSIGYAIYELLDDRGGQLEFEISIALAVEFRGKGLGSALLDAATLFCFGQLTATRIEAYIFPANAASVHLFQTGGYQLVDDSKEPWRWQRLRPLV